MFIFTVIFVFQLTIILFQFAVFLFNIYFISAHIISGINEFTKAISYFFRYKNNVLIKIYFTLKVSETLRIQNNFYNSALIIMLCIWQSRS